MAAIKCPRCGYVRQPNEAVSEMQCPSCKVFYAKHKPIKDELIEAREKVRAQQESYGKGPLMLFAKIAIPIGAVIALSFLTPLPAWLYFKATGQQFETSAQRQARLDREAAARRKAMEVPKLDLSRARITMYSAKFCESCNLMRRVLESRGVPFVEHMIDQDKEKATEVGHKIQALGYDPNNPRLPVMDVNGKILIDPAWLEVLKVAAETS